MEPENDNNNENPIQLLNEKPKRGRPKQPPKEKPPKKPIGRPKQPPKETKGHFWERDENTLNKLEKTRMKRYKKLLEKVNMYDNSDAGIKEMKEKEEKGKKEQFKKELIITEVLEKLKLEKKEPPIKILKMIDEKGEVKIIKY